MLPPKTHLFSLPPDLHYLNCASRGPLLRAAEAAGVEGLRGQSVPAPQSLARYHEHADVVRERAGALVGAGPDRVAIVPAVSYGMAVAAHATRLGRGDNVVLPEEEFPSLYYTWQAAASRAGAEVRIVPRPAGGARPGPEWSARIVDAVDGRTRVVALSSVHWTDGVPFDLEEVGARARAAGALFAVDGTQHVGAMPFSWEQVRPDILVCASYKWLLGPYQVGFAVLGDRLLDAAPFEHHWSNRAGGRDMGSTAYHAAFRPGARRFDVGESANEILLPMLAASIEEVARWRAADVSAYCAALGERLVPLRDDDRFRIAPAGEHAPHIIGIRLFDPSRAPAAVAALAERRVTVSLRGEVIRVSPYVYNTGDDMDALVDGLRAALA